MTDPEKQDVIPGTGWCSVGNVREFLNGRAISLLIAIVGSIVSVFGDEITETIKQAPLPDKVKIALTALTVWATATAYEYVFPQRAKSKKRGTQ